MSTVAAHLGAEPVAAPVARRVPNAILGMLVFLAAEAMFFAGLVSAFLVLRAGIEIWPPPGQPRFPLGLTSANTAVLLLSGFTALRARTLRRRHALANVSRWLGMTAVLGLVFVGVQGIEWARLVGHGLQISGGVYGGLFTAIIGAHGLHVLGGVVTVWWAWRRARALRGAIWLDTLTAVMLYWLFVVAVWPLLFWLVYLK